MIERVKLEILAGKIKMLTGHEFTVTDTGLELELGSLSMKEMSDLSFICKKRGLEYEITTKLKFKITKQ